jgi:anaerobic dimethyl sulfoxide reductase subunit A
VSSENTGGTAGEERTVLSAHCSHCGGTCLLKVHVRDGVITRIETDDGEGLQYRACARGRAYRQRVYAPDRLKSPLKRVGKRGESRFEQISWDEAFDTVAGELKRVKEKYGPASILFKASGGDQTMLHSRFPHIRLLSMFGGFSDFWGVHSFEGALFSAMATFGTVATTSTRDNLLYSRMIILWGCNPADTVLLTNTIWYLTQAREAGTKIVCVDPKYTNTVATYASQWIPLRPGTDAAMLIAMAYVIIRDKLQDQRFIDTHTIGFERFRDYVMGLEDGEPKTTEWAETITSVPAGVIETLAREYATNKPAALIAGIAPGRTAYGEQYHRAASTLAAITGNLGVRGGDTAVNVFAGAGENLGLYPFMNLGPGMPIPPNPVESKAPRRKNDFPSWGKFTLGRSGQIHIARVADAILKGKAGGYPADYKLLYVVNNNFPNQYLDLNKCVRALQAPTLEFIVVFEQFMTSAAKFADVVLPVNTCLERNDITTGTAMGFYAFLAKAVDSVGESKSHLEICVALANRLGISDYNNKTEDEWLKQIATGSSHINDYDAFKKAGGYKVTRQEPYVAFGQQIEDPRNNPFPTPSGNIEIYCQRLADMNDPLIPPIPKFIETWESRSDALAEKYPLQLITTHLWRRAHSQYDNIPWLRELEPQAVWMNPIDAERRRIQNGDMVRVFNNRGVTVLPAKITNRIMPGIVDIAEGAWYDPDEHGIDRGGCANVLTRDEPSPGGAYPTNTSLVQVEKAWGYL